MGRTDISITLTPGECFFSLCLVEVVVTRRFGTAPKYCALKDKSYAAGCSTKTSDVNNYVMTCYEFLMTVQCMWGGIQVRLNLGTLVMCKDLGVCLGVSKRETFLQVD